MAQLALEAQLCLAARFASWGLNVGPWWLISWGTGRMWECPGLHHSPHPTGCVFSKDSRLPCIPFPTPISCLFSCPFPLFLCLKEECSLILCALPIPSCLALPWPLPQVSPKFPGMVLPPQLPCNITPAMLLLLLEGTTAKPCSSRGDRATSQLGGGAWSPHHTHTHCSQANLYLPLWLSRWRNVRRLEKPRATQGSARGRCCCDLASAGMRGEGFPEVLLSTGNPHGRGWPCGTPWSPFLFSQK